MSGGSLDYAYLKVDSIADTVRERARTPLHLAFSAHLSKVSDALHALEWMFSCDIAPGDEVDAIMEVVSHADMLEEVINKAMEARKDLDFAINLAKGTL